MRPATLADVDAKLISLSMLRRSYADEPELVERLTRDIDSWLDVRIDLTRGKTCPG